MATSDDDATFDVPGLMVWSVLAVALGLGNGSMVVRPILLWVLS